MAEIVAVHGIGQYGSSAGRLRETWLPALREGLTRAGAVGLVDLERVDLDCVYYADELRPGGKDAGMVPAYGPADIEPGFEQELLTLWWRAAAAYEPDRVPGPDSLTKIYSPQLVQRALASLSRSTFWSAVPRRVIIAALKDLRRYLYVPGIRKRVQARIVAALGPDTRIVIGHSLGSVVAYEALHNVDGATTELLLTVGSPLGIPHLVLDRLEPPSEAGQGVWPAAVRRWVNVAGLEDTVALVKDLAPVFGRRVEDHVIRNGLRAHDVTRYLASAEVGRAVADAVD
ncbi:hypothetical protein IAG44_01240 [Streptomyces roseirectus]|uniref:Serine peptidase n=1 Tax=Streptomyces roseirectus TaxID=2768066 RepID=A0A7H0I609_9ACTN|nr:hypothetical protein [Streptomyces roseirectus]QNP68225.1 hypothetical protein IAG44_01240 [Streptomyces roseirectus]